MLASDSSGGNVTCSVLWKRASSESGNYTVTWSGTQQGEFRILRISGASLGATPIANGSANSGVSGTSTGLSMNTFADNSLVLYCAGVDRDRVNGSTDVTGTDWVKITSGSSGGAGGAGVIIGSKDMPVVSGSPSGNVTSTFTSDDWATRQYSIAGTGTAPTGFAHSQGIIVG